MAKRQDWITKLGAWKYHCFVLADFDPIKANEIWWTMTPLEIAEAVVSRTCYTYKSPKK